MDERPQNYWQPGDSENDTSITTTETETSADEVRWRSSEYVHHDKGFLWYLVLGVVTFLGTGLAVFFQQWIFAALILMMGITLGVYARRPPREISYSITPDGVYVNNQLFPYSNFRSFGVVDDGAFFALQLRPTKRFMPAVTMYFAETDGERIIDTISAYLPMEDMKTDAIDKLMQWLRF